MSTHTPLVLKNTILHQLQNVRKYLIGRGIIKPTDLDSWDKTLAYLLDMHVKSRHVLGCNWPDGIEIPCSKATADRLMGIAQLMQGAQPDKYVPYEAILDELIQVYRYNHPDCREFWEKEKKKKCKKW